MNRKVLYLIIIGMFVFVSLPAQAADETVTIGLSLPSTTGIIFEGIVGGARVAVDEAEVDVELVISSAEYDVETELANVQALIDQEVDVIILMPTDSEGSADAIAAANEAGIPVFSVGEIDPGDAMIDVAGTFALNAMEAGTLGADVVCGAYETGTLLELVGYADDAEDAMSLAAMDVSEGFNAGLADACPDAATQTLNVAGLDRDAIFDQIADAIAADDISLIFAHDDESTLAAIDASFRQNVNVVGVGISEEVASNVEQIDHLLAVITLDTWGLGQSSVTTSLMYLSGEDVLDSLTVGMLVLDLDSISTVRCFIPGYCGS